MTRTSEIRLAVHAGADGVTDIRWEADDAPDPGEQAAEAMILALWDGERRNAMRIDLWTPRLTVDDMNDFVYQTLLSLGDSYHRATGNDDLMAEIKAFARAFAQRASGSEQRAAAERRVGANQPAAAEQRAGAADRRTPPKRQG